MIIKSIADFDTLIKPKMDGFSFEYVSSYSEFANFGSHSSERVEFSSPAKLGCVSFWETGWIEVGVYDLILDRSVVNLLLTTEKIEANPHYFDEVFPFIIG